ncbi:MAG: hypothetical protein IT342_21965 [Candidatus Melainabacteria bacterium]|nr:hypothetical protein [Candidatus Melainabacteria bacterium]
MTEVQKQADQAEQKSITKTAEAVKEGGVIAGQPNQEVHGKAFELAHQNDKTLSEPDMIAMNDGETVAQYNARVAQIQANRFGFYDSAQEKTNDAGSAGAGGTKVHEHPAKQALEPLPVLSPPIQKPPFDSHVKANVQITNVPEVSEAVQQEVLGQYAEAVLENAAAAVRQVENHLAQPNAINSDFQKIGRWVSEGPGHFAQSPEQLNKDVSAVATGAMEEIDKPLSVDERAKKAGMLLPMFFFEGGKEPINPETIDQLGLEAMSEAELKALGIEKRVEQILETETGETVEALESSEGLAKLAKKFGINMPPKDTYVFAGEKDAISAEAASRRLGITKEELAKLDETALVGENLERVPDYRDAFFNANPGLIPIADRLYVHHSIPKWILKEQPGLFAATEINSPEMLRGIYKGVNDELHNSLIHSAWREFRKQHPMPTRSDVLDMVESLDVKYGHLFAPEEGI